MSWRDVLDSSKAFDRVGDIFQYIEKVVIPSGYKFFTWNGHVMMLLSIASYQDTGLTVDDLY